MSDDKKQNDETTEDASQSARQSPVIARDVVADPSRSASADLPEASEQAKSPKKPVTTLTDKLKAAKFEQEHPDPVVTQQGVSPQDDEDEPANSEDEDGDPDEDLGVFLEEIFPDGDLPEFSMPGKSVEEDSESDDQHEPESADESSTEVRGSEAAEIVPHTESEDDEESEPIEDPEPVVEDVDSQDDASHEEDETSEVEDDAEVEPVVEEDEPQDVVQEDEEIEELDAPAREDFFEETDLSEVSYYGDDEDDVPPSVEQAIKDEEDASQSPIALSDDELNVPIPAVALSPDASPAAPLDTDGLPVTERDVRGMLERIGALARSCNMTSLSKEIHQERLPTLDGGRITLVVLGEFNHGKSTVINALLGDEVLPMGITPTTAVITHLVHADQPVVTIQPAHHGTPYTIAYDEMEQAVKESGEEGDEPEYVEIGFPNEVLSSSLVLVDTPGVNDISRQKVEITYGYLPRADVILYVLDATQVLKKSEVTFIKDRLLKSSSDRIIFVLNKIDALSPDDIEEVVEYARERLTAILGPVELFTFSGRKALQAQLAGTPLPEEFTHFQSYLQRFLQEQRAFIILDSALSGGLRVSTLMEQNLAIKRQGYRLERADLDQRIIAVRSRLKESRRLIAENTQLIDSRVQGIAATARHNLRIFTEQFAEQLPLQIDRADAGDVKKFLPTWIQETYKEWLEKEGSALARSLEELAEEIIQITNESLQQTVQSYQKEFGLTDELDLNVDTVAYDVGVFALGAFGVSIFLFANIIVGSLLTLATPMLAYFFKEKVEVRIKERAREQGAEAIKAASEKLEEELLRVIHGYGDRLKEFVEMAGDRLYRQIEEALQQVQQETSGDYDREELLTTVTAHLKNIQLIQNELHSSRTKLEEWATSQDFS